MTEVSATLGMLSQGTVLTANRALGNTIEDIRRITLCTLRDVYAKQNQYPNDERMLLRIVLVSKPT